MATLTADVGDLVDSTPLLQDADALAARAEVDGYLYFRGLLPRDSVIEVRRNILEVLDSEGWLAGGHDLIDGVIDDDAINLVPEDQMRLDIGISRRAYVKVQQVQSMHRLPHHPAFLSFYRQFFNEEPFVHPRHIVRVMTSHASLRPTPPHQDFPLVQGSQNTWTCWFPLGDCPRDLGPLSILRGSHRQGYLPVSAAEGAGGIGAQLCDDEDEWLSADFQAGDVLTFPALTVHRALPPQDRQRVRLSMDIRFQPASEPIEARSLSNHSDQDWAEIYAGWDSDDIQYYWKEESPRLSPWDQTLMQPGRRIC